MAFSSVERRAIEALLNATARGDVLRGTRQDALVLPRPRRVNHPPPDYPGFLQPKQWHELVVAQFRRDANSAFGASTAPTALALASIPGPQAAKTLRPLLAEVDRDPTGIFWG